MSTNTTTTIKLFVGLALCFLFATEGLAAGPEAVRDLVRVSLSSYRDNVSRLAEYSFLQRVEKREFSADGRIKSQQSRTFLLDWIDGVRASRMIERDDRPLAPEEERRMRESLEKSLADYKRLSPEERSKRAEEARRRRRQENAFLEEIPDAFEFRIAGEERVGDRDAWVVELSPRPGFQPRSTKAKVFQKMRGRVWIDKSETQWVKAEAEAFDTVTIGGILARIEKGTRFHFAQVRLEDGVWLPERQVVRFHGRVVLVKGYRNEVETTFRDYRRRPGSESRPSGV